jgi:hypothetical protein
VEHLAKDSEMKKLHTEQLMLMLEKMPEKKPML